jgi:hypothetical protein
MSLARPGGEKWQKTNGAVSVACHVELYKSLRDSVLKFTIGYYLSFI